ncbi:molybdopterin-dependent oxidoreductase [Aquibacillus halophilus]|uniref:Molybdopterin-dependent oxidoreductase n=1 Tax=Aquibacillus halophilus TaxID=930132 RepID=A0A6A8D8M2_9BACI|nr:molybdopterin-dependent oxidoreductase [Aquibacillus halophilus]MRH42105.1 molybdopterin-dependent oxidoreductase [Aquibacillus halophilus]
MNWRIFFKRNLKFAKRLARLHHTNALLFYILSITGLVLISTVFRSSFPSTRVLIKDIHIWIGFLSILPIFFYLPKMKKHLLTLKKRKKHRINLYGILAIISILIISGIILTFQRQFPPQINSYALLIHDLATWIGLPYVIYHSITRSQWFKQLTSPKSQVPDKLEPTMIDSKNPLLRRRSFLKLVAGAFIAVVTIPIFGNWIKKYFFGSDQSKLVNGNDMVPIPTPQTTLTSSGREGEFRYYTVTEMPSFSNENWSFKVDGLVSQELQFTWTEFINLKRTAQESNFHCVTGWSVYNIIWEGIPLKDLLEKSDVNEKANYVKLYSGDGVYTDTLTLSEAMMDDIMVAVLIDGELITQQNGGPVRLITPRLYAYKSVKWLTRVELIEEEHFGYWEQRGYPQNAWVQGPGVFK